MSTKKKGTLTVAVPAEPKVDLTTIEGIKAALTRQQTISESLRSQYYQSQGACEVLAALLKGKQEEHGGK